jgi:membrane-anchored protein YejM (alkaline phosphatase superfamily)
LGPIILYILMMVEIKNRRTYAGFKSWDREQQEYKKRQQALWKYCGELFLALMLTRQILSTWNNHLYRELLLEQY